MLKSQFRSQTPLWALAVGALLLGGVGVAQQRETPEQPEVSAIPVTPQTRTVPEGSSGEKAARREPRGRLPAYFSAVVSQKQRDQIYGIQAQYDEKLTALRLQIDQLVAQRDKEVDGVLTPEQLAEVNKKREAAESRRKSRRAVGVDTTNEGVR